MVEIRHYKSTHCIILYYISFNTGVGSMKSGLGPLYNLCKYLCDHKLCFTLANQQHLAILVVTVVYKFELDTWICVYVYPVVVL